jgi:hypothetical protein
MPVEYKYDPARKLASGTGKNEFSLPTADRFLQKFFFKGDYNE